jgi:hypothetical protein
MPDFVDINLIIKHENHINNHFRKLRRKLFIYMIINKIKNIFEIKEQ